MLNMEVNMKELSIKFGNRKKQTTSLVLCKG